MKYRAKAFQTTDEIIKRMGFDPNETSLVQVSCDAENSIVTYLVETSKSRNGITSSGIGDTKKFKL